MDGNTTKEGAVIKLLYTIEEAAQALGLGRSLMYVLVLSGQVPSIKIGRSRRVPVAALRAYVDEQIAVAS